MVEHLHLASVLENILKPRLLTLNPWLTTAPDGTDAVFIELRKLINDELLPANKAFWERVVHRSDIQVKDNEGKPHSVRFFDASTAPNNDFHVVDQYVGSNIDDDLFRPDLLLFVNGLPMAIVECKASHHRLDEALAQLDGYRATFPNQFVFNQVSVGLNGRQGTYGTIFTPPAYYAHYRLQDTKSVLKSRLYWDKMRAGKMSCCGRYLSRRGF